MFQIENLNAGYGESQVLRDVSRRRAARVGGGDGPQRHGQDHAAEGADRHAAGALGQHPA